MFFYDNIQELLHKINLKKQEIGQLRAKDVLTLDDENTIIDNTLEIASMEARIFKQKEKEAEKRYYNTESFGHGLPSGHIGFMVQEKKFVPKTESLTENYKINPDLMPVDFEEECILFIEAYNKVLEAFLDFNCKIKDYSALGLFLSKIIENEINHSLVQMIRKCHGIEMPDYYCKVKNNLGSLIVKSGNRDIDLNATDSKNGGLNNLALGEACFLWHQMHKESAKYNDFITFGIDDKLYLNCKKLTELRNYCVAHSEPTSWGDFCEVFNCFQNIMKYHMPNLMEVKNLMRHKE